MPGEKNISSRKSESSRSIRVPESIRELEQHVQYRTVFSKGQEGCGVTHRTWSIKDWKPQRVFSIGSNLDLHPSEKCRYVMWHPEFSTSDSLKPCLPAPCAILLVLVFFLPSLSLPVLLLFVKLHMPPSPH